MDTNLGKKQQTDKWAHISRFINLDKSRIICSKSTEEKEKKMIYSVKTWLFFLLTAWKYSDIIWANKNGSRCKFIPGKKKQH